MTLAGELAGYASITAAPGCGWLAPQVTARVALALRSLGDEYRLVSAARSNAVQARLYDRFVHGGGPPAAKPGASKHNPGLPGTKPVVARVGPHVERISRDGWAVAVDVGPHKESAERWQRLERGMLTWGMWLTVGVGSRHPDGSVATTKKGHEPWHFEPMPDWRPSLLTALVYVADRIRSLPGAPDSRDAGELMAWFRAFAQGRPFDPSPVTQHDLDVLGAVETFLAGQTRSPLP